MIHKQFWIGAMLYSSQIKYSKFLKSFYKSSREDRQTDWWRKCIVTTLYSVKMTFIGNWTKLKIYRENPCDLYILINKTDNIVLAYWKLTSFMRKVLSYCFKVHTLTHK